MDAVDERERLLPLYREVQRQHQAAVVFALELLLRHGELVIQPVHQFELLRLERHVARGRLVVQEQEEIHERDLVMFQIAGHGGIIPVLRAIVGKERLRRGVVHAGERGKAGAVHLVAQTAAVHGLDPRQPRSALDLAAGGQLVEQGGLGLVIACRYEHGEDVLFAEPVGDRLFGKLLLVLLRYVQICRAVGEVALAKQEKCAAEHDQKQQRDDLACGVGEAADERDLRHKAFVLRFVHPLAEEHQQRRHQHEHGEQTAHNGLDEHQTEVRAQPELHERHSRQPRDGREAAGADLRNGAGQRLYDRLADRELHVLLLIPVAEDDCIVDRERKLQHDGHGVGDERDPAEQEVCALIEQRRGEERQNEHQHLGIGLRREDEHGHDHERHDDDDDPHLRGDDALQAGADLGGDRDRIARERLFHLVERGLARGIVLRRVERHAVERRAVAVVRVGVVIVHHRHAVERGERIGERMCLLRRHVLDHDLRRTVRHEFVGHDLQTAPRLRLFRQEGRQLTVHLDPAARNGAERQRRGDQNQQQPALLDDPRRHPLHAGTRLALVAHAICSFYQSDTDMIRHFR